MSGTTATATGEPTLTEPTYRAIHLRLISRRGSPKLQTCPCGKPAEQWAYQHTGDPRTDSQGRVYSINLEDYSAMCRSCHNKLDQKHGRRAEQLAAARLAARTPEAVAKMAEGHRGQKRTPEQRENIRQGALRRWRGGLASS